MTAPARSRDALPRALPAFVVRFVLAYVVLATLAVLCESPLNDALAPCVKLGMTVLHPELDVRSASSDGSRLMVRVVLPLRGPAMNRHRLAATLTDNGDFMLVGPLLTLSIVLAYRFGSVRKTAAGFAVGALLAVALGVQEVSQTMVFEISGKLGDDEPLTGFFSFFLDSGGRQVVALLAGGAAIWLVSALAPRRAGAKSASTGRPARAPVASAA